MSAVFGGAWFVSHVAGPLFTPLARAATQAANAQVPNNFPNWPTALKLAVSQFLAPNVSAAVSLLDGAQLKGTLDRPHEWHLDNNKYFVVPGNYAPVNNPWRAALWASYTQLPESVLRELTYRGQIDVATVSTVLSHYGYSTDEEISAIQSTWFKIPAPQEILDMSLRGGLQLDNPDNQFLLEEIDPLYLSWAYSTGLGGPTINSYVDGVGTITNDFAKSLWASHWSFPSSSRISQWALRFREDPDSPGSSLDQSGIILDPRAISDVFKVNSVLPQFRKFELAAEAKIPGIRYLQQLAQYGQHQRKDTIKGVRLLGYTGQHATDIAELVIRRAKLANRRQIEQNAKLQIESAWQVGAISDQQYLDLLVEHGQSQEDASLSVELAHIAKSHDRIRKMVSVLRRQYLKGQISRFQAQDTMGQIGTDPSAIQSYLTDWDIELMGDIRELSASQIVSLAKKHIVSLPAVTQRLTNLRYTDLAINAMIADIELAWQKAAAAAAQKIHQKEEKDIKAREKAIKDQKQAVKDAQRALASHGSPSQLASWLQDQLIDNDDAVRRLRYLGWPNDDIDRLLESKGIAHERQTIKRELVKGQEKVTETTSKTGLVSIAPERMSGDLSQSP